VTVSVQSSAMGRVRSGADVFLTVFPGGSALAGVQEQVSGGGANVLHSPNEAAKRLIQV